MKWQTLSLLLDLHRKSLIHSHHCSIDQFFTHTDFFFCKFFHHFRIKNKIIFCKFLFYFCAKIENISKYYKHKKNHCELILWSNIIITIIDLQKLSFQKKIFSTILLQNEHTKNCKVLCKILKRFCAKFYWTNWKFKILL